MATIADPEDMARLLIVDDDEVARLILGHMLQDAGYEVAFARDGEAALEMFKPGHFDAVITDLAMPVRNGLRLIQDLQEQDRDLPLIAMSGTNADQLQMAEDFGAKGILYKPLEPEAVIATVEKALKDNDQDVWAFALG